MKNFDRTLQELARSYFQKADPESAVSVKILPLLDATELTNAQRNELLQFVYDNRYSGRLSISEMKQKIFKIIDYRVSSSYSSTVNRSDIEAIYNYLLKESPNA